MQKNNWAFIIFLIFFFSFVKSHGQTTIKKIPLKDILERLSDEFTIQFNYKSDLIKEIAVFPIPQKTALNQQIKYLETETALRFTKIGASIYTITKTFKICGYLKDSQFSKKLEGATIKGTLENTTSNSEGYFEMMVASLNEEIEIRFLGYETIKQKISFFNLEKCETLKMTAKEEQMASVILEGYLVRGIDKNSDGTTTIDFNRFTALPGLIETDVLQTVQALPGVLSVDETVSNINIRGGSHDQNLILWDDIKMYQSGHFFGLISSFNPQITKTATLINNGTDASFTDGVSGSILMKTEKRLQKKFEGSIGINFISADLFADIPLGEKSSLQLAARRSINDLIGTPTYNVYFDRVIQETEIENNTRNVINSNQDFNFYDTSLRWLYNPSEKDFIRLNFIIINNSLTFDEMSLSNEMLATKQSSLMQNSVAAGLKYERKWNDSFTTNFNFYNTDYKLKAINSNVIEQQEFLQENIVSETGIKLKGFYTWENFSLESGYQFIESEITNVIDIDVPRFLRRNSDILRENALFTQGNFKNNAGDFSISPGLRVNYIDKFKELLVEPRLQITKKLGDQFQIELLAEFKHQNTSQIINFQNDFLGVEKRRWQLADNDSIPILKSKQISFGTQFSNNGWLVDATGYYKEIDGITSQSQSFTTKYEFTKTSGNYNVFGIDFLIRKQIKNVSSWLSYSYMNNTYIFKMLEDATFPSNFDITHSLTLGTTYSKNNLNISAGLNYRTGKPTSQPLAGNEVIDEEINFDTANNTRIEDYLRVDASARYKFKIFEGLKSEIGLSILNALNKKNTINDFYRIGADNNPNKFSRESLGLTTNFTVRLLF